MELIIAFLATGLLVIISTIWRIKRFREYSSFIKNLCDTYQCDNIDLSGDIRYTDCISHKWALENLVRRKHGKLGLRFQDLLFHNTLSTAIGFSLLFGLGILIFGVVLIRSIQIAGTMLFVFLIGGFAIIKSEEVHSSESLLSMLQNQEMENLTGQDYAYGKVAMNAIRKGIILSIIVGTILVVISPWGNLVPFWASWFIAELTLYLIWTPTMYISKFSFPLAILYMSAVWPVLAVTIIYAIQKIRGNEQETNERAVRI
jgi:hypothetical protein